MSGVYLFDTETTDRTETPEIIEAAWVRIEPDAGLFGAEPDRIPPHIGIGDAARQVYSRRFLPSRPVTCGSIAVHHILPCELEGCPPSSEFRLPEDCAYLIGHSIDFDWRAIGSPANVNRICTDAMARWTWPDADGYSQSALLYMLLGANEETRQMLRNAHSALADVTNNLVLLRAILQKHPEIPTWSQLFEYSEKCRIPRTCPMKKYEGVLLADLDRGFIDWCLNQHWLDPYFRKGLEQVLADDERASASVDACDEQLSEEHDDDDVPY